jgi:hypothetical protein
MRSMAVLRALTATALVTACAAPAATSAPTIDPGPAVQATPTPTEVDSPSPSQVEIQLTDRLEAEITVPGSPDRIEGAFGSIWVLAPDLPLIDPSQTPNLVRIDPATNEVVATIPVPDRLCQGFVASDDAIWVCAADALMRVDPDTNTITDRVPITGAQAFYKPAFGGVRSGPSAAEPSPETRSSGSIR